MKKRLLLIVLSFVLIIGFIWISNADYQISAKNKIRIDELMKIVESEWEKETTFWQIDRYKKIVDSFSILKNNFAWDQKEMIWYLVYLFENKLLQLKEMSVNQNDVVKNIDWDKVQKTILQWHNEERKQLWLKEYKINEKLNYSALVWADNLAKKNIKSNTHTRNPGDWYYNYDKILSWFNGLWINFDYKATAFTESVAYQVYSCNKSDCTQDMINALKKWFDFWMSEKWKASKPHYNAIVHNTFSDLWFWVAISGKWYWIVVHYGVNVK